MTTQPIPLTLGHLIMSMDTGSVELELHMECPVCHSKDTMDISTLMSSTLLAGNIIENLYACESSGHVYAIKVVHE